VPKLHFRECTTARRFIIKIEPGTRISAALVEFAQAQNIRFASLVSAVGSVRNVEFTDIQVGAHLPMTGARTKTHCLEGPLELMGLEGNIAVDGNQQLGAQFHLIASKSSGEVIGGRLVEAEVFAACEIVLAEYVVDGIERHHSATSGVDTLYIGEK
jgi:predicted DNA-binding protein with PD1-like motif